MSENFHYGGVAETLFIPSADKLSNPWLATSYEVSSDFKTATIKLVQNATFQKGNGGMTAEDVAWTVNNLNAATNPKSIHGQAGDFAAVSGEWTVVDQYTVQFPIVTFDPRLADNLLNQWGQAFGVVSKKVYDEKGADFMRDNPIGTGPYQVVECRQDDHLYVEARPDPWDYPAKTKSVQQIVVPDPATRLAMMRTGQVDAADISPKDRKGLLDSGFKWATSGLGVQLGVFFSGNLWEKTNVRTGQPLDMSGIYAGRIATIGNPNESGCNRDALFSKPVPDDSVVTACKWMDEARKVRTALAMAIDKEAINDTVLNGTGQMVQLEYLNPEGPNWQSKWDVPFNVDEAKQLLGQTQYGKGFDAQIYIGPEFGGGGQFPGEIGDAISGMWQAIGVKTTVLKYNYPIFRPTVVQRSNTIPWLTSCDEGKASWPFDWPHGFVMTTRTRGGFSCGLEDQWIANYLDIATKEPDMAKRTELAVQWADHMRYWMLAPGVVTVPEGLIYNPTAINAWTPRPSGFAGYNSWWDIVPAKP
jgi:ABC-type transport system substrate-binding protein